MRFSEQVTRHTRAAVRVAALAAFGALVIAGASAAGGAALAPPPGGPDLSRIALSPEDFSSSSLAREGYVRPARDLGFVAEYDREFNRVALGTTRKRLAGLEDDV